MSSKNYLKENTQKIETDLERILLEFLQDTKKTNPKLLPFASKFVKACEGGKRIRGVLCKLGYELGGGKGDKILQVSAAWEIVHTALLIHDDIIDQSPKRRGQASLYQTLGGNHYGISQAITLGDIGLYLPIKIIAGTKFSDKVKIKAVNYFSQILINTGWGQIMDVEKDKDAKFINLYKTAKYTIAGPLQIGAILAGAEEGLVKNLGEFGENAGIAFQIQDDILDRETNALISGHSQALEYALKAKKIIPKITKNREMAIMLEDLTEYLVERTR